MFFPRKIPVTKNIACTKKGCGVSCSHYYRIRNKRSELFLKGAILKVAKILRKYVSINYDSYIIDSKGILKKKHRS